MQEAWQVGVRIAMAVDGMNLLADLTRHLGLGHDLAKGLTSELGNVKVAALAAVEAFAGFKALEGLAHLVKDFDLNTELTKIAVNNQVAPDKTLDLAVKTMNAVPGTTLSGNVKMIGELGSQLGGFDEVEQVMDKVAKLAKRLQFMTGEDMNESSVKAAKFADLTGQIFSEGPDGKEKVDPHKFAAMMDVVARISSASGGMLGPADLLAFAKQAGVPIRNMSEDAMAAMGEAMVAMGASRAGTAETSLLQQFAGGQMSQRTAKAMVDDGLIREGEYDVGRGGQVVVHRDASDRLAKQASDPAKLAADIAEKLAADGKDKQGIMLELFRLFGRQTTQRLMADLIQGAPQMERFKENYGKAQGTDQAEATINKSAEQTMNSFTAAWKSLMEALGNAAAPVWMPAMNGLAEVVRRIATAVAEHPNIAAVVLGLAGSIAALVALHGTMTLASVAIGVLSRALGTQGLATAAASFASGGAGFAGLTGLISLLGAVTKIAAVGMMGYEAGKWIADKTDITNKSWGPVDRAMNWAYRQTGLDGSGSLPEAAPRGGMAPPNGQANAQNGPMPVIVTNGRDLSRGVTAQQAREAARPDAGPTGFDAMAMAGP